MSRLLADDLPTVPIVSSMDLASLLAQADALSRLTTSDDGGRFARPELDTDFEAPRDDIEKSLAELWGNLLGVEGVGIHDSFFDLGGHSLIAVRLFNEISDRYDIDMPMSVLLQSPDIARLGELIRGSAHD
ncbi:MAG: phosphopantetheine-binding protein, partial [Gammaproteobacteria bacterium]|nr:phosphopantetheine-binding protein [Gammaproteobacteria bacterium]